MSWISADGAASQSLAYGPSDHIHWVYGTQHAAEIKYVRFPSSSGAWDKSAKISNDSYVDYDPRVAAACVNDSGVWVLYNRDQGGHEIDLMNVYSSDGGLTWNVPTEVAAAGGVV